MQEPEFEKDFIFGAATAAFQIEGGAYADGKGLSIWDVFCRYSKTVHRHDNGDRACNSYELYKKDVELLCGLGADAYRFSVSWPRVLPDGIGKVNQKGLDYYRALVDELRENGIEPYVTLYHWDLPYQLSLKGGLLNRDFAGWFTDYAEVVAKALGDGVETYFTFNEPLSIVGAGYGLGTFAPGIVGGDGGSFPASHHLLLAHGDAAKLLHGMGKKTAIVCCGDAPYPADESDKTLIQAVRRQLFAPDYIWSYVNVFDPIFLGDYCREFYERYPFEAEYFIKNGDLERIRGNTDYCCMNHYSGDPVTHDGNGGVKKVERASGYPVMSTGWPIDEKGIYWTLKFLYERYKTPLILAENGMANNDFISSDGKVHDYARVEYFRKFLTQMRRVLNDGIDLRGYFAWSLLDNFEWLSGYSQRFGLAYVDYDTYERTPKDSYYYLRDVFARRKS